MKAREIERFKPQTPLKKWRERGGLIDNKLLREKILSLDIRLMVKKNGFVN